MIDRQYLTSWGPGEKDKALVILILGCILIYPTLILAFVWLMIQGSKAISKGR